VLRLYRGFADEAARAGAGQIDALCGLLSDITDGK
jgi:hypothetical protein